MADAVRSVSEQSSFLDEVQARTPGESRLLMCIQCGTCGGSCPSGADMDHTPRQLFAHDPRRHARRGPQQQHPLVLRLLLLLHGALPAGDPHHRHHVHPQAHGRSCGHSYDSSAAPDFSKTFINWVENYGRAFELGLMSQHMLRHNPLGVFKIADMGVGMVTKGRMDFTPKTHQGPGRAEADHGQGQGAGGGRMKY